LVARRGRSLAEGKAQRLLQWRATAAAQAQPYRASITKEEPRVTTTITFSPEYLRANGWGWMLSLPPAEQDECFADLENDLRDEKERLERENSYEDDGPQWRRNRARLIEINELLGETS
jgi:hypothetical protein